MKYFGGFFLFFFLLFLRGRRIQHLMLNVSSTSLPLPFPYSPAHHCHSFNPAQGWGVLQSYFCPLQPSCTGIWTHLDTAAASGFPLFCDCSQDAREHSGSQGRREKPAQHPCCCPWLIPAPMQPGSSKAGMALEFPQPPWQLEATGTAAVAGGGK